MSPIKGLTESRRLPRLGKIHLGIKVKKQGTDILYPKATDYFVVPPEVAEKVGEEKPRVLPILFPIEDEEKFASQYYRSYSMTRGLVCRGDGETCRRMVDVQTGEMANRNSKEITWKDGLNCKGRECPYYGKQCKEVMNLQFLLPTVEGLGVWQIDTSSINSIRNINSAIDLIRGVYGRIAMIPLLLTLEPIEVTNPDDGKKKTVRVLNLRTKGTMLELMEQAVKPAREMLLPAPVDTEAPEDMPVPDDEPPELIMPQNQDLDTELFPPDPPHAAEASDAAKKAAEERAAAEATAKAEKQGESIPKTTEELFEWVAISMGWKGTGTVRSWLVNKVKLPEEKIDSDPLFCYHEAKALMGW